MEVGDKTNESHGWRGILIGRDLLKTNTGWVIGDGRDVELWNDPWLTTTCQQRPMGPAPETSANLMVAELIDHNRGDWDREKIQAIIPHHEEAILKIKLSKTGAPDKIAWLKTSSGEYTTKSGYWTAYALAERDVGGTFQANLDWNSCVWKNKVAPKIKLFLWKIFQGALPVGERLAARNITADPLCKRCGGTESIHHLLFHCEFAQRIWASASFSPTIDSSGLIDLAVNWSDLMDLTCLPPTGIPSNELIPWLLWSIWNARNNLLFNKKTTSPEAVVTKATASAREWLAAQETAPVKKQSTMQRGQPLANCFKLQTDAAWREDVGTAGLEWCVTKNSVRSVFGAHCFFVASPLIAEASAMREAICKCKEMGFRRLSCETDSMTLAHAIKTRQPPPEVYGILVDIFRMIPEFEVIGFRWIPRGKNKEADSMAKNALLLATNVLNSTLLGP